MSYFVYQDSLTCTKSDSYSVNVCHIGDNFFEKIFDEYELIKEVSRNEDLNKGKLTISYIYLKKLTDYWILLNDNIYRCINAGDKRYAPMYIYFSHYYFGFALEKNIFTQNVLKQFNVLTEEMIDQNFALVNGKKIVFEYTLLDKELKFFDHDGIVKCIQTYLIDQNTIICKNQVFMIVYDDINTKSKHVLPIKISLIERLCDKDDYNFVREVNFKRGFRFDSDYSKNITFIPSLETHIKRIYTKQEHVHNIKISWNFEKHKTNACNFVDHNIMSSWILEKLNNCAFKVGFEGTFQKDESVILFKLDEINNKKEDSFKDIDICSYIYYISVEPTNIQYNKNIQTSLLNKDHHYKIVFTDDLVNNEDNKHIIKLNLLYKPSPTGNVIFMNSKLKPITAENITIDVKCLSDKNGNYIMWKKSYNALVPKMLMCTESKAFGNDSLELTIDGIKFKFMVTDFTPRTNYVVDQFYQASQGICFDEKKTHLTFHAKHKNNKDDIIVIICENDGDDIAVELECVIQNNSNNNKIIEINNLFDLFTQLNSTFVPENKSNPILLDEKRIFNDIIKSDIIWENKEYNFIVPQHNISLKLIFRNIIWKNNNVLNFQNKSLNSHYVGSFDPSKTKIKWVHNNDIYIVPEENSYHEKTKQDVIEWTKKYMIGGLDDIIWDLYRHLIVLRNPKAIDILKRNGLKPSKGVIMYGPAGNGKTKLARCLGKLLGSREEHINLVSGTQLLSKWLGESEKNIARLFEPAEKAYKIFGSKAPLYTIIIDEIDIIAQQRGTYSDCSGARDGMVNQLLTALDGLVEKDNIILIGLTNREQILDSALLREGRLDRMICIDYPNTLARIQILNLYIIPWINIVNENDLKMKDDCITELVNQTDGLAGSDLQGYVSFVVNNHWSSLLGSNADRQYIPIEKFKTMFPLFLKSKS